MNYLAHFHLSFGDDELLIGALLGDFIKGPLRGEHSAGLEHGIMLHRKIDAFTDSHPDLKQCHQLFDPQYRRFAGIMTDVAFDHFLSRHWQRFSSQSLDQFSRHVFDVLLKTDALTSPARTQAANLARHNVFVIYRHWQTVDAALVRIGQRFARNNPLPAAGQHLSDHYKRLEQVFLQFYPELQGYVQEQRRLIGRVSTRNTINVEQ